MPAGFEAVEDSAVLADTAGVAAGFASACCSVGLAETTTLVSSKDTVRFRLGGGFSVFAGVAEVSVRTTSGCALGWPDVATRAGFLEGDAGKVVLVGLLTDVCPPGSGDECRPRMSSRLATDGLTRAAGARTGEP